MPNADPRMSPDWLIPQWDAPGGVASACSTRAGGLSLAPYDSLNLGDHVGDEPAAVAANRRRFATGLGARPVFLQQVHGTGVVELGAGTPDGTQADACFTRERGVACTIMVADCLPVLLAAVDGSVVGAAHAGWRGLAEGVVEALLDAMSVPASGVLAWLGPCIGPTAFEVGAEVKEAFTRGDAGAREAFRDHAEGKFLADLPMLARRRLAGLGVEKVAGNDGNDAWCTVRNPSIFFSHRRDRVSGRFAASVWRR